MSQREFAERLTQRGFKVDASAVSRIENGSRAVRLAEAMTIADVLDFDLTMLIAGLDRSPEAELKSARRAAQAAYEGLREPLVMFANSYMWVHQELLQHPELTATLTGVEGPVNEPAGYFRFAAERIRATEVAAAEEGRRDVEGDYSVYDGEIERDGIRLLLNTYLDVILMPADEHRQALGEEGDDGEAADAAE